MPRFRSSHSRNKTSSLAYILRLFVVVMTLGGLLFWGSQRFMTIDQERESGAKENIYYPDSQTLAHDRYFIPVDERNYLPASRWPIVHHRYYSLAYDEDKEQSAWVCYILTKKSIQAPNVRRTNWYSEDGLVESGSSSYYDFKHKDYTRGHLAPAGDMAFNQLAMKESFLMSNMSPQLKNFNDGVWNELEQATRDWAYRKSRLVITSGPVFIDNDLQRIGSSGVAVPHAFYKAIFDMENKESIAFVIPHEVTDLPLSSFAVSINDLEELTGLDLMAGYFASETEEERVEASFQIDSWPVDQERYRKRVEVWNRD